MVWLAALVVLAINAAYGFEGSGMRVADILARPEPQYWISEPFKGALLETTSLLASLPSDTRIPLPYTWMFGVSAVRVQSALGYPWGSFFGEPNTTGHVAFFPLLALLKTPGVLLFTGFAAVWAALRSRTIRLEVAVVGTIALGFLLIAMTSRMNMGVRHVLPVLYLSSIWSAVGAVWLWERLRGRTGARIAWWGATVLLTTRACMSHADFLGYFNIGRTLGHQVSVVGEDVGQDRFRFAQMVQERRLYPIFYDSQTATRALEVRWAGLRYSELNCHTRIPDDAYAAIHVSRRPLIGAECLPQLSKIRPVFTFGDHIDIYHLRSTNAGSWSDGTVEASRPVR